MPDRTPEQLLNYLENRPHGQWIAVTESELRPLINAALIAERCECPKNPVDACPVHGLMKARDPNPGKP